MLEVSLGNGVRSVSFRITNNAKMVNHGSVEGISDVKHLTMLMTKLVPDARQPCRGDCRGEYSLQLDGRRHENIREDGGGKPKK